MFGIARASSVLATLIFCAYSATANPDIRVDPDPVWRNAESISELTEIFELWLDEHSRFERREAPADVRFINSATAASMGGNAGRGHGRTRGLYDQDASIIYLIQPWDPLNAEDASVLLHELLHHRQTPQNFVCLGAREEATYRLQDSWLGERGLRADVNWFAVVLEAGCTPRDIHPDR